MTGPIFTFSSGAAPVSPAPQRTLDTTLAVFGFSVVEDGRPQAPVQMPNRGYITFDSATGNTFDATTNTWTWDQAA